jgi:hypothetical protein
LVWARSEGYGLFSFSGISDSKEYDGKKMIYGKLEKE